MYHTKRTPQSQNRSRGQSVVEVAVGVPFLLAIVVALIEMGMIFASFLSVVTATHDGAFFASNYPTLAAANCGDTPAAYPPASPPPDTCVGAHDNDTIPGGSVQIYSEYYNRASVDILAVSGPLQAQLLLDPDSLIISRPITDTTCTNIGEMGCAITVTVTYQLHTLLSAVSVPYFGRFGLPSYYTIQYSMGMPIRHAVQ